MIGHLVGAIIGAVGDHDMVVSRGIEIDMVDAYRHTHDDLAMVELLDGDSGNGFTRGNDQSVGIFGEGDQLIRIVNDTR